MRSEKAVLHAIGNAHIDPVWLWRWTEGLEAIRSTFRSALDRMNEYPEFIFTGSSAAFYHMLKAVDPEMLREIRERVREGRWEIAGGWWVQPDVNIPCGESLVRQALYGQRFFQQEFGVTATAGYNPDTFGHPGTLPQILRKAGLTHYAFLRPQPHEKDLPGYVFVWESPDGSRVTALRIGWGYGSGPDELDEHIRNNHSARPDYVSDYTAHYGVGNHGGGPTKRNIESILAAAGKPGMPEVRLSSLEKFFSSVEGESANGATVPVVRDELQHHARGCYTSHSGIKRDNRRLEHLLMSAERFSAAAWALLGRAYPRQDFVEAWQDVLFQQFHDVLAGTSLPEAYEDARDAHGRASVLAGHALHYSLQTITSAVDTRGEAGALVVFNPLPWPVKAPIEVERGSAEMRDTDGNGVPSQGIQPTTVAGQYRSVFVADLPALGYRVFRSQVGVRAPASSAPLIVTPSSLENTWWRLELDEETGHIAKLTDKVSGVEVLAGQGAAPVVIEDLSDTWSHDVAAFRNEIGRFTGTGTAIEEDGPVRASLRVEMGWGASSIIQRYYLYRDSRIIEIRTEVNWQEHQKMLKLAFPINVKEPEAVFDVPYGFEQRKPTGEEEPSQQWVDVTGHTRDASGQDVPYGVALLNDCKYGLDVLDSEIRLTLLRSPAYANHDPDHPVPERRYQWMDQGIQTITCRLVPHAGAWQDAAIAHRAFELNVPPLCVNEYIHGGKLPAEGSFLEVEPDNIVLTVLKLAEDSDQLVLRGYETAGRPTGALIRLPMLAIEFRATFHPHEIKTWRLTLPGGAVEEVDLLER